MRTISQIKGAALNALACNWGSAVGEVAISTVISYVISFIAAIFLIIVRTLVLVGAASASRLDGGYVAFIGGIAVVISLISLVVSVTA